MNPRKHLGKALIALILIPLLVLGGLSAHTILRNNHRAALAGRTLTALAREVAPIQVVSDRHYVGVDADPSGPGGGYCFFFADVTVRTKAPQAVFAGRINSLLREQPTDEGFLLGAAAVQLAPGLVELKGVGYGSGGVFDPRCW